jgi:uncharacterized low-complexity protein
MFKKIIASVAVAGALTLAVAAPAVVSAAPAVDSSSTISAIGNWPDPMRVAAPTKATTTEPTISTMSIGNWPDPM